MYSLSNQSTPLRGNPTCHFIYWQSSSSEYSNSEVNNINSNCTIHSKWIHHIQYLMCIELLPCINKMQKAIEWKLQRPGKNMETLHQLINERLKLFNFTSATHDAPIASIHYRGINAYCHYALCIRCYYTTPLKIYCHLLH